ncbi:uncharacterized protein [Clytia hemisphaerica]|uniref:uncharacterized protein n=1 Tax=Clytia hemisphaerica TaxID=252671 RepID=UPI0034D698D6
MCEKRSVDEVETDRRDKFYNEHCCKLGKGSSACHLQFIRGDIEELRDSILELHESERDMMIIGFLLSQKGKIGEHLEYSLRGTRICREFYLFSHAISKKLFSVVSKHFEENGPVPRVHGNTNRLPHNVFTLETREMAINFVENYAMANAVSLPGRVANYRDEDAKKLLIPSYETKESVYNTYRQLCIDNNYPFMGSSSFSQLWKTQLPNVSITKPMGDLCWECQQNNERLLRAHVDGGDENGEIQDEHEAHVIRATQEARYYKAQVEEAKLQSEGFNDGFSKHKPCSFKKMAHYSWDYAQQTHYPSDPMQPGPIFFKTPRKCGIFGICNDGLNLQYNFLIDEICTTGKGANATISYLHYFFERYGMGETDVYLHADNCSGQNKNNAFLWYLMWRILNGLHEKIEYSFMIAGHTKFSCDRCFGSFKKKLRSTYVSSLYEIGEVCDSTKCNFAVLVGNHNKEIYVKTYDWTTHFEKTLKFLKFKDMLKYHHFRMSKDEPGIVSCLETLDAEPVKISLFRKRNAPAVTSVLPDVVEPKGFTKARADYLRKEIRQFCKHGTEKLVAP